MDSKWATIKYHRLPKKTIAKKIPAAIVTCYHTHVCLEARIKSSGEIAFWERRWPRHCRECDGAGVLGSGEFIEPCFCTEEEICPRCGFRNREGWSADCEPCEVCGWDWGNGPDDAKPQEYECYCWLHDDFPANKYREFGGSSV